MPSDLGDRRIKIGGSSTDELNRLCEFHKIDVTNYKGEQSIMKIARNLVDYQAGLTIFNTARNIVKNQNINQIVLF